MELDHVGIAVRDAKSTLLQIEALIGVRPYKSENVDAEGVRTYFLRTGGTKLELLEAIDDESPIARHIAKRGPGLHHLAFEVDDLDAARERFVNAGFSVIGTPRPGADGKHIFFLHPRDTHGVLYEFCRTNRSSLEESTVSVEGRHLAISRAGASDPVTLIIGGIPLELEALARRLEQSTRVVVADQLSSLGGLITELQLEEVHLIVAAHHLPVLAATAGAFPIDETDRANPSDTYEMAEGSGVDGKRLRIGNLDARIHSLIVLIDEPTDLLLVDQPVLVAARPSRAAAAIAVYERLPGADLAVGSDDLLVQAIDAYIRRQSKH